eukprot:986340-Pelagomonas_calceolata.AAC.2
MCRAAVASWAPRFVCALPVIPDPTMRPLTPASFWLACKDHQCDVCGDDLELQGQGPVVLSRRAKGAEPCLKLQAVLMDSNLHGPWPWHLWCVLPGLLLSMAWIPLAYTLSLLDKLRCLSMHIWTNEALGRCGAHHVLPHRAHTISIKRALNQQLL